MNNIELLNRIKEVSLSQQTCNSTFDGNVYDNWNNGEVKYGSVNADIERISYNSNLCTYSVVLYYGDRLLQDKSNFNQIITDGVNTLQSVINLLNKDDYIDIPDSVEYVPFEQKFCDYLAGVYCQFDLITDSAIGLCTLDDYEEKLETIDINNNGEYQVRNKRIVIDVPFATEINPVWVDSALPEEYQEVEYIQSDGDAYVSTNIVYSGRLSVVLNYYPSEEDEEQKAYIVVDDNHADVKFSTVKVIEVRIVNKSTFDVVADLIPCYRKSDSEKGFYDTINEVFYGNAGEGEFTIGNDSYGKYEYNITSNGIYKIGNAIVNINTEDITNLQNGVYSINNEIVTVNV